MNLGKVIMTGVLATVLTSATFAAVPVNNVTTTIVKTDQDAKPQEIKVSELPDAVKETLDSDAYKGWVAKKAFIIKNGDKNVYKVEAQKGEENTTLLFNEEGKPVEKS